MSMTNSLANLVSGTASTAATSSSANSSSAIGGQFMQMLVAQLKNQDPLNPMDPTAMTSQLTQLNSLQQLESINSSLAAMGGSSTSVGATLSQASSAIGKTAQLSLNGDGSPAFASASGSVHYDFGGDAPYAATLVETDAKGAIVGSWKLGSAAGDVAVGKVAADSTFTVSATYSNGQSDAAHSGAAMLSQNLAVSGVSLSGGAAYLVGTGGEKAPWSSIAGLT